MAQLRELYQQLLQGEASAEEQAAFMDLLMDPEREAEARELLFSIAQQEAVDTASPSLPADRQEVLANSILAAVAHLEDRSASPALKPVYARHIFRKWRWAAALLVAALGLGGYFWLSDAKDADTGPGTVNNKTVLPGGNRATLTLADGSRIVLDDVADGLLASQGNASIVKLANGQIVYDTKGTTKERVLMNTMTTPRGGQYRIVLPDGTKAWLNAASSLTYPVSFTGPQRKVMITGEAYFEVAENKAQPFVVNIGKQASVEVLGTHFNINSYADHGTVETTLLEGSIKLSRARADGAENAVIIRPGQQALMQVNAGAAVGDDWEIVDKVDLEKVMAWKNGIFYFQDAGLFEVMKQLERWYDIDVQFSGKIPVLKINGKMDRGLTLQEVLEFLTKMEVHATLNGRTLIVEDN